MNRRTFPVITVALVCALCAFGQTTPTLPPAASAALPTYVGAGATYNQIGTPRWNLWATAIYPVSSSVGVYTSTSTDVIPVLQTDPTTKRQFYAFNASVRQGVHKVVYSSPKFAVTLGGDAGVGMSQAAPSGINVSFAGSVTGTLIYQLSPKWSLVMPLRGLYLSQVGAWNVIPEFGVLFKP